MFRRVARAAFAAGLVTAPLAACAPITTYSGFQAIEASPKDVKVAEDSKTSVRQRLGSPSVTSTFDPNVWFYIDQVKERIAFRRAKVTQRNVTAITFNKDSEAVERVDQFSLKDGRVIAFNGRETPTRGRELSILEQLLGTVGRGSMLPRDDEGLPGSRPGDQR